MKRVAQEETQAAPIPLNNDPVHPLPEITKTQFFAQLSSWPRWFPVSKSIHPRSTENVCPEISVCGRVLSSKAALHKHAGLHSGKKLFSCSLCSEIFPDSQKSYFRREDFESHGRVHTGTARVLPCDLKDSTGEWN
ncbi:unnamed protein product [Arctogadus glacialis]